MMKVLHTFNMYLLNSQNWAYRMITGMKGVENYVTANEFLDNDFYSGSLKFWRYPVQFIANPQGDWKKALANKLIMKGVRKFYPVEDFLLEKAKATGIELLHAHFSHVGWEYQQIAQKLNIPLVISFYGYDYECLPFEEPVWKERYKQLFHTAAGFICEGTHGASILERMGCDPKKIHVVRLGVKPEDIPFFERAKQPGSLKLVQIAALREKKGHIYTLQAFNKALANCPNMSLTLVGTGAGDQMDRLTNFVKEKGIQDKVEFLPQIDYSKLYPFLKDFDAFIHPSCYSEKMDCEGGAPVVLLDAQATGMPVISTTHCDIPDEVLHDQTGLLAAEKNVEELAQHIETFYLMDEATYLKYAESARRHVKQAYDISVNAQSLVQVYTKVVEAEVQELQEA